MKIRIILFLTVLLLVGCIHPKHSFTGLEKSENKIISSDRFGQFQKEGVEKSLDVSHTNPDALIETARKFLGVPHCMGGTTKKCMDCSGLLVTTFAAFDISLPHSSEEQARYGKIVSRMEDLKKGDLVFFIKTYHTSKFITHSGIYIDNKQFIHTSSQKGVSISSLESNYWKEKFIFGTRIF